jgi:HAD superfamily phosphoserine phosphatase-like hydrolase
MSLDSKIMKPKNYPKQIWSAIESATTDALRESSGSGRSPVAAFDADGTLWDMDLGESFFKYQIQNCSLSMLKNLPKDPWEHYHDWKASGDPRPAYLWLAQINEGQEIKTVRKWATECIKSMQPLPIFEEQRQLIEFFLKNKVTVYVVTASVKWSVEPGAKILGVPQDQVLGVATAVENGIVTTRQDGTITYREGKAQELLNHTNGQRPFFCSGNTTGDLNLLKAATHLSLAVRSCTDSTSELFHAEAALQKEAEALGWLTYRFQPLKS